MKVALVAAIGSLYDQAVNHYQIFIRPSGEPLSDWPGRFGMCRRGSPVLVEEDSTPPYIAIWPTTGRRLARLFHLLLAGLIQAADDWCGEWDERVEE